MGYTDGSKRQGEFVNDQLEGVVAYYLNSTDNYSTEFWKNGFKVSDETLDTFTPPSIITENSFDKTSFIGPDDLRKIWTSKTKFSSQALKKMTTSNTISAQTSDLNSKLSAAMSRATT